MPVRECHCPSMCHATCMHERTRTHRRTENPKNAFRLYRISGGMKK